MKKRQEISVVYCTNRTKRLMEKYKKKTIEQSSIRKASPIEGVGGLCQEGFKEKVPFEFRVEKIASYGK